MQAYEKQGYTVKDGQIYIENIPVSAIAAKAPTPLYIYSVSMLKKRMQEYVQNFKCDEFHTRIYYASKAFNTIGMLKLTKDEGLGVDVVSLGELYTALKAGYDPKMILFHGNNKSEEELRLALENNIGCIVLDNLHEARMLARLKEEYPKADPALLLRVNPGMDAHTHKYIVTGNIDSKFGVARQNLDLIEEIAVTVLDAGYRFTGFHCHIGSQIFDKKAFITEVDIMSSFIKEFEEHSRIYIDTLDLGGGFAAWYTDADEPIDVPEVCETILTAAKESIQKYDIKLENLWIEPGRSITANAGATLYTIGSTKRTPNKEYYFIDGGMSDNIRPALYQADYSCDLPLKMNEAKTHTVCVAGKCCESGDIIVPEAMLPEAESGDLLITYTTGAYGYSMASHYNKLPVPGVLFVENDKAWYAVKPESLEDLIARETENPEVQVF